MVIDARHGNQQMLMRLASIRFLKNVTYIHTYSIIITYKRNIRVPIGTYLSSVSHLGGFQKLLQLRFEILKLYRLIIP